MTKKETVIIATLAPYRPRLPERKIAIALGDSIIARNIKTVPASNTQRANLASSSNARFIAPPAITDRVPITPHTMLQNAGDLKDDRIILMYESSDSLGCM